MAKKKEIVPGSNYTVATKNCHMSHMSLFSDEEKMKFVMDMMAEVIYNELRTKE